MPAAGTWIAMNKQRPGAYINFISVNPTLGTIGERGIVACALPMDWGPNGELIRLTGTELRGGASLAKIGYTAFDVDESLPYRLLLSKASTALLYRLDEGGTKAEGVVNAGALTATAKHPGIFGNRIGVAIVADPSADIGPEIGFAQIGTARLAEGEFAVYIYVDSLVREEFVIKTLADLDNFESDYVDFTFADANAGNPPIPNAGITLTGGTNGEVTGTGYSGYFDALTYANWQCMTIMSTETSLAAIIADQIVDWRENFGKKVQGVVYGTTSADHEGVVAVKQGFVTSTDTVTEELFPLWVASLCAGSRVNESNTAAEVPDAFEIINPVPTDEIAENLLQGWFLLSFRQDGAVCIEQDINTLHTYTQDKNYAFSKNRVIRTLDEIGNTIALRFNRNFAGKVDNTEGGRATWKADVISVIDSLVQVGAITNFNGSTDVEVFQGNDVDVVVCNLTIQPVDAMEKLYMTVYVNA